MSRRSRKPHDMPDDLWEKATREGNTPLGVMLSDVVAEKITWLWEKRIPRGKLTILDGDPGNGKSVATVDLAARASVGRTFPDGAPCPQGGVVLMNAEDGLADTIRPRLDAAGGDASKVMALATVPDDDGDRLLSIPEDIPIIEEAINRIGAVLVIVDPLMAFLSGGTNAHKDQDVRRALAPLAAMAERTGAAVVVVRHLNKVGGSNALYRGGGSIGIIGAARSGLLVAKDPEDNSRRVLAVQKSNVAEEAPSLVYRIVEAANGAARVEWQGESGFGADQLLKPPVDEEERSALDDAKDFLRAELARGPVTAKQVLKDARDAGISEKTLYRAKSAIKVRSEREADGSWTWHLPTLDDDPNKGKAAKGSHAGQHDHLDHLGKVAKSDHLGHLGSNGHLKHTTTTKNKAYIKVDGQDGQDGQGTPRSGSDHLSYDHLVADRTAGLEEEFLAGKVSEYTSKPKDSLALPEDALNACIHDVPGGCWLCSKKGGAA